MTQLSIPAHRCFPSWRDQRVSRRDGPEPSRVGAFASVTDSQLDFRVLGPLEAVRDGEPVPLDARKPRALLALLLIHANQVADMGGE